MAAAAAVHAWSGDLKDFSMRFWYDESEIAAISVAKGRKGVGWLNLRHVTPQMGRIVTSWCSQRSAQRPPWDILYADELAELAAVLGSEQRPAEAEE